MRLLEEFDPKGKTLYHYCGLQSFLSIIANKTLWLCDINTMNDFGEMHWAYEQFISASNLVIGETGRDFIDAVDHVISEGQLHALSLLTSFSTDGDVLSQWRAYAEDGLGVSIGFDAEKIDTLSVRTADVEYDQSKQIERFRRALIEVYGQYKILPKDQREEFLFEPASRLAIDMSFFKNPAFSEEKEVRIIRLVTTKKKGGNPFFADVGGNGEKVSARKLDIKFRAKDGGIVSYVELPLSGLGAGLITEVVLGPKTRNSGVEVSAALCAAGFTGFKIRKSRSTYR